MDRLKRMQDKVEWVLTKYPMCRDNDRLVVGAVYSHFYGVDMGAPFRDILLDEELPNFETIRRCRQKAQELHEELRGSKWKEKQRIELQKEFIEYSFSDK